MNTELRLGTSPMMLAYAAAQAASPKHLVLYRVGEFYEVLGQSAATMSRALGIQMTRRRQKDADDVLMCGIPAGTSEQVIARLLAAGHKVAFSEQPLETDGHSAITRSRPLCVFPQVARYAGQGDRLLATNWRCDPPG